MRLSTDRDDHGYPLYAQMIGHNLWVYVYLDGERLEKVVTADDEAGYVLRYQTDAAGQYIFAGEGEGASLATETLSGKVVIEIAERAHRQERLS